MLIRFIVKNLFSFKEETEFNLLPGRAKRLEHHKYNRNGIDVLKQTAIYGANGSGKSNLVKAIAALRLIMTSEKMPELNADKFKLTLTSSTDPVELGVEFSCNNSIFFYQISFNNGVINYEYFGQTGDTKDILIFERETINKVNTVTFSKDFEQEDENRVLKQVIEKSLLKPDQSLFFLLNEISKVNASAFDSISSSFFWVKFKLILIVPGDHPKGLVSVLDSTNGLKSFAKELICSFNAGITDIYIEKKNIEDYIGNENQNEIRKIKSELENNHGATILIPFRNSDEEITVHNDSGNIIVKRLVFAHKGEQSDVLFNYHEESDGTRRLLDFIPVIYQLVNDDCTFIIDEMERSLHPTIIKELISKFSNDENTKGQLIFTTHESNLLDQDIFRTDEIWFAEKSQNGATKLYSLSDYKEHSTIDIRKGYLTGRYGAIPFLGNLHDLNWHNKD